MSRPRHPVALCLLALWAAVAGPSTGARADEQDAERRDSLIGLLMVEESVRICDFAIDEAARQRLAAARASLAEKLLLDAAGIDRLRADLDRQFQADRVAYCAPDGPWKKAVEETLGHLPSP
jgi:hypothetical protein